MTDLTAEQIAAKASSKPKTATPRSRTKSTAHDGDAKASATSKKAAIAESIDAVAAKAIADAQALAQETYASAFLSELNNQQRAFDALSFETIQGKAKQKTANILKPQARQLQLAGGADTQPDTQDVIVPCEQWIAWESENEA
jgi:hypothetical protein